MSKKRRKNKKDSYKKMMQKQKTPYKGKRKMINPLKKMDQMLGIMRPPLMAV